MEILWKEMWVTRKIFHARGSCFYKNVQIKHQKDITSVPSILSQGFNLACEIPGPRVQLLTCLYLGATTFYVPQARHHKMLLIRNRS